MTKIITVSEKLLFALWEVEFLPKDMVKVMTFTPNGTIRKEVMSYKMLTNLLKEEKEVVII